MSARATAEAFALVGDDPWRRRTIAALRDGRALAPEDAAILLRELRTRAVGESAAARRYRRDCLIREIAAERQGSVRSIAREIGAELARYAAIAFQRDRAAGERPSGPRGMLFDVLTINSGKTVGSKMLENILARHKVPNKMP